MQAVHLGCLAAIAAEHDAVVAMAAAVGDTLVDGMPLLRVYGGPVPEAALRRCLRLGAQRPFEAGPRHALRVLVDVATKALSPPFDDAVTAVQALDQIEDLLVRLGRTALSPPGMRDRTGRLRVVLVAPPWEDFIALGLDEIRFYGAHSAPVMRRVRGLLLGVMDRVPPERRPPLRRYLERMEAAQGPRVSRERSLA
jgi:uncharacterized membrane protein